MNSRWITLVSAVLIVFAVAVVVTRFVGVGGREFENSALSLSFIQQNRLASITNIIEREQVCIPLSAGSRQIAMALPENARVFMPGLTGPENLAKLGYYFFMTYALFPREVALSMDKPTFSAKDGYTGRAPASDHELATNGYSLVVEVVNDQVKVRPVTEIPTVTPPKLPWFNSRFDMLTAFSLPVLTALAGMLLVRFLVPGLIVRLSVAEYMACGLGLGMMILAAATLGMKLCGMSGGWTLLGLAALGAVIELCLDAKLIFKGIGRGIRQLIESPVWLAGLLIFVVVFRMASVAGLLEFDAVGAWALKAKVIHLCTGSEIVKAFSDPRLAHAHLDYPTLVPSLHAATYDALGHVNEFVTKFWPAWMLLLLVGAAAGLSRGGAGWAGRAPGYFLLALVLLPATQKYVLWEGGTMPMIFFTAMGAMQCSRWIVERDPSRLALGLVLLFGAAMAKFEGMIFLALVVVWLFLVPSTRPGLRPSSMLWRGLVFSFFALLPFACLRARIPALHWESGWVGYALHNPLTVIEFWPRILLVMASRLFVNPTWGNWNASETHIFYEGKWDGFHSLYNFSTLGLGWLCVLMTVAVWFAFPSRRKVVIWILAVLVSTLAVLSGVFASNAVRSSLATVISGTSEETAGRYLLPIMVGWAFALLTTLYGGPEHLPSSGAQPSVPAGTVKAREKSPRNPR